MSELSPGTETANNSDKPAIIQVPKGLLTEEQIADIAARSAVRIVDPDQPQGRFGLGVIEVPMPANPPEVPGYNGIVRH